MEAWFYAKQNDVTAPHVYKHFSVSVNVCIRIARKW